MKFATVVYNTEFDVIMGNARAQAAVMVVPPGGAEGGAGNRHKGADQWLYVVEGKGRATVNGKTYNLGPDVLLLIEQGDIHEIKNTGAAPLKTLNFYAPPAYTEDEEALPAGRS
jgi:mannose-6-phosphate isomerase-like protein (cupin superfamily)